ncbi:hypothetical protein ACFLX9_04085 [Chloroflexota bacterium]
MALTDRETSLLNAETGLAEGVPISRVDRLATNDNVSYQQVVEWTVAAGSEGDLHEISLFSDDFSKTQFRLTIAGVQQWTDRVVGTSLSIPYRANRLPAGAQVLLQARSTDGTLVTVDGSISGAERPTG